MVGDTVTVTGHPGESDGHGAGGVMPAGLMLEGESRAGCKHPGVVKILRL